jgi:protoporphyrinogen oxidase
LKTAILGAGVSGLSLARFLVQGGFPPGDLTIFEAAPVAGGLCRSKRVDGFTYDVAGGHILFSKDKSASAWMKAEAGGDAAFVRRERHTKIRFGDRWVHYPFENGLGDLPPQANFECLKGYVDAWRARTANGAAEPADFGGWIRWRFGEGIARHFMEPYNDKIWKRPLGELSSDWVAGRVPDAPIDDVLKASIGIRTEGYVHQSIFDYPLEGGFQALTDGLARSLAPRLRLATPVAKLVRAGDGWSVDGERFDRVVSTVPLNELAELVEGLPSEVAGAMRALRWNGLVSYLIALDRPVHPELSWVYLPAAEQGPANRVTYMSNYSPRNAPAGRTSLLAEVTSPGGPRAPEPSPELEREVVEGLARAGILERREVLFVDRAAVRYAYIVYVHGFARARRTAIDWLESVGIVPHGRFGRYDYDNSDQCVIKSRALAQALAARAAAG